MRALISGVILLLCTQFTPVQAQDTGLIVSPVYPLNCQESDHSLINWVWNIQKVQEDETTAAFSFSVKYGQCIDGKVVPYAIDEGVLNLAIRKQKNCFLCSKKAPATIEYAMVSPTEVSVLIVVNKKKAFKKGNQTRLKFIFTPLMVNQWVYYPNGGMGQYPAPYDFPWNVDLYYDDGTELLIR